MAKLNILTYPDKRLRQVAKDVTKFDGKLKKLVRDMAETMVDANGIGLAAVQVNVALRVVIIDLTPDNTDLQIFINPRIEDKTGSVESEEGCLSVPEIYALITRADQVTILAKNLKGEPFELVADGMLAVCIQHEIDHLDGKVFVDYLSRLKQARIKTKLLKELRHSMA